MTTPIYLLFYSSVNGKYMAIYDLMYYQILVARGDSSVPEDLSKYGITLVNSVPDGVDSIRHSITDNPTLLTGYDIEITNTSCGGDPPRYVANLIKWPQKQEEPKLDIFAKLDRLSFLSRETNGASFNIQHEKSTGLYKVSFSNVMLSSKYKLTPKPFDEAIEDAIAFIEANRVPVEVPTEKYTMFRQ